MNSFFKDMAIFWFITMIGLGVIFTFVFPNTILPVKNFMTSYIQTSNIDPTTQGRILGNYNLIQTYIQIALGLLVLGVSIVLYFAAFKRDEENLERY